MGGPGGSSDSNPEELYTAVAKALSAKGLDYLHVVRPNSHESNLDKQNLGNAILDRMRAAFTGPFIANGEFTPEEAARWIEAGRADAIAFGRLFLANPDLVQRIAAAYPDTQIPTSQISQHLRTSSLLNTK